MTFPHINETPKNAPEWFDALLRLARYLRGPDGCPWDREQTSANFAGFTVGEAQEFVEAFQHENNEHIAEEFGDTLFCLLMAAVVAEDEGRFTLHQALENAHAKMIRRHGHIFGEHTATTPDEVVDVWRQIKAEEQKQRETK